MNMQYEELVLFKISPATNHCSFILGWFMIGWLGLAHVFSDEGSIALAHVGSQIGHIN
jgi:hypothetical protein